MNEEFLLNLLKNLIPKKDIENAIKNAEINIDWINDEETKTLVITIEIKKK